MEKFDSFLTSRRGALACWALGAVAAVWFGLHMLSAFGLLVALLAGLWIASLLLSLRAVWIMVRHPQSRSKATAAPLLMLAALSLVREGGVSDVIVFDVSYNQATRSVNAQASSNKNIVGNPPRADNLRVELAPAIISAWGIGRGFRQNYNADNPKSGGPAVRVTVSVTAQDAACWLPLYKSARVPFEAAIHLSWADGAASGDIHVSGQVEQTVLGICSCRAFNEAVGRAIEDYVAGQINQFLRAN